MPVLLEGSCICGAVRFAVASHTPHPYQLCYCSICRKTAGGGGFAVNLGANAKSLKVRGKKFITNFHARIDGKKSPGERSFCSKCGSALWVWDPRWPELIHPFARSTRSGRGRMLASPRRSCAITTARLPGT